MTDNNSMNHYIVATIKPWNIAFYKGWVEQQPGNWTLVSSPEQLQQAINKETPKYIFFPHWSWIVPEQIVNQYNCICFHMTDLPYGRGGSPLQNLIVRGHKNTKISALKMTSELDAGPIYLKKVLSLNGSAQEIFERATPIIFSMIEEITLNNPSATNQQGDIELFQRRTPDMSELPKNQSIECLYDHIRMLDADTYPRAFLEIGSLRIEFSNASFTNNKLQATVSIKEQLDENHHD
jgi:methionyl-tRNA formyltransferase